MEFQRLEHFSLRFTLLTLLKLTLLHKRWIGIGIKKKTIEPGVLEQISALMAKMAKRRPKDQLYNDG